MGPVGIGQGAWEGQGSFQSPSPDSAVSGFLPLHLGSITQGPQGADAVPTGLQRRENSSSWLRAGSGQPPPAGAGVLESDAHGDMGLGLCQVYSSGRHSVRITGISSIDFRAGFSTQPSLDLNHTIEWPLQGTVPLALG